MKITGLFILLSCFFNTLGAQTAEYFHFTAPKQKVCGSLYNSIRFIDSRADTTDLGHVYGGPAGRRLPVWLKTDLYTQCNWLLYHLTDSSAKDNELLFQLRKLEFDEDPEGLYYQEGFCALRADLYCKKQNSYFKIARLDTLLHIAEAGDITPLLFEATTEAIAQFLTHNAVKYNDNSLPYLYHEVLMMDSVDKSNSELFARGTLTQGVYLTFGSFRTQSPNLLILYPNTRFGSIVSVEAISKSGKKRLVRPKAAYAIVYGNTAYVSKGSKFYAVKKEQDDFYFTAELKNPPKDLGLKLSTGTAILIGTDKKELQRRLNGPLTALYKIKVDHIDGSFVTVKRIIQ